ncbi:helix-turn-helix domain-containing protein [Streptomyces hokutonensis]|uniref:helix-turn-helix domain-containing protein n=1 Tax=Streptomyces hokutonensis TaxID=1306990 RepID=UPI00381218CB
MTIAEAASALGISRQATYAAIRNKRLAVTASARGQLVSRADVNAFAMARRVEAVRRHRDLVGYARQVKSVVWPTEPETVVLSDGREQARDPREMIEYHAAIKGRDALHRLDSDAVAVFGPAVINTLADLKSLRNAGACAWCWARDLAAVRGGVGPSDSSAVRELIGEPCAKDRAAMKSGKDAVDRLWQGVKADDRKRRAQADTEARRREYEAARADVERATRRLAGAVTASGFNPAAEAARYRQQAAKDRAAGDEVMARHMETVAARIEQSAS